MEQYHVLHRVSVGVPDTYGTRRVVHPSGIGQNRGSHGCILQSSRSPWFILRGPCRVGRPHVTKNDILHFPKNLVKDPA